MYEVVLSSTQRQAVFPDKYRCNFFPALRFLCNFQDKLHHRFGGLTVFLGQFFSSSTIPPCVRTVHGKSAFSRSRVIKWSAASAKYGKGKWFKISSGSRLQWIYLNNKPHNTSLLKPGIYFSGSILFKALLMASSWKGTFSSDLSNTTRSSLPKKSP